MVQEQRSVVVLNANVSDIRAQHLKEYSAFRCRSQWQKTGQGICREGVYSFRVISMHVLMELGEKSLIGYD